MKTPLAAIAGASSSLLESASLDDDTRRQLLETVADEAARLNRLLENILQMSKLDAGAAAPSKQWHVLEEIVGSALHRVGRELAEHDVRALLPGDLPLLSVDGLLLEQVFVNLLENAARYTPAGAHVTIDAAVDGDDVRISVADDGPGLPSGSEERIFDKFYRASLNDEGYRVTEANNGTDGLRLAAAQPPDLVILDLGLADLESRARKTSGALSAKRMAPRHSRSCSLIETIQRPAAVRESA